MFRRSLYVVADMRAGDRLTAANLRSIRPGYGLPPRHYDTVLGKAVRCDVKRGTPLSWELV
jgi:sialic acid synthase SpsE